MADISTIIVKADVHMSQNTIDHDLYNSVSNNAIQPNKKSKSKDLQFSGIDDIEVIESESTNISNNEKKRKDQLQNKHRWSLRIKFQTYEDENTLSGKLKIILLIHCIRNCIHDEKKCLSLPDIHVW